MGVTKVQVKLAASVQTCVYLRECISMMHATFIQCVLVPPNVTHSSCPPSRCAGAIRPDPDHAAGCVGAAARHTARAGSNTQQAAGGGQRTNTAASSPAAATTTAARLGNK